MQSDHIHQAIKDLATIRQAIERADAPSLVDGTPTTAMHFGAHIVLQVGALTVGVVLLAIEAITGGNTAALLYSAESPGIRAGGLGNAAFLLAVLVGAMYFTIISSARRDEQPVAKFIARNFRYLKNFSFPSDLFVKFAMFTLLIAAPKPEWVAPLLCLYVGDHLFQGKFFSMRTGPAFMLGGISFAAGYLQFQLQNPSLVWPLILFCAAGAVSIATLWQEKRSQEQSNAAAVQ